MQVFIASLNILFLIGQIYLTWHSIFIGSLKKLIIYCSNPLYLTLSLHWLVKHYDSIPTGQILLSPYLTNYLGSILCESVYTSELSPVRWLSRYLIVISDHRYVSISLKLPPNAEELGVPVKTEVKIKFKEIFNSLIFTVVRGSLVAK